MHQFVVNVSMQIIPVVLDKHPYLWVDEAIAVIEESGVKYKVQAFDTVLEGTYDEVMKVIKDVNERLYSLGCAEWISHLQIQVRSGGDITGDEKTEKFN